MRGEGAVRKKKKQTKKQPEKATSSVFVGSFCTFGFTCAVTLPHLGKDTLKKEPGIYLFFLWKTFWDNTKKKLIQVHNEIFYMIPDSSSMFFCPRGEHPHVRQFFGRWVICLKVLPFAFRTNRRLLLPALLLHRMRRQLEIIGLKSKLIDHLWMNKRFRYFVQSCMKLSLNFWVISLKKNPDNDDIYSRNNFHIIKPWRQQHLRLI